MPETATRQPTASPAPPDEAAHPIIFFDGVCGLCNRFVDFVMPRDRRGVFRFSPLQGETAKARLAAADIQSLKSVVLVDETGTYRHSTAVVRVLWRLGGGWKILGGLMWLVPRPLRNLGYAAVSRLRYLLFGKKDACRMPTPAERARFLP